MCSGYQYQVPGVKQISSQLTCSEAVCDIVELLTLVPGADIVARLL